MPRKKDILGSPCRGWMMTLTWLGEGKKEQSSALLSLLSHTYFSCCCCCILFLKVATRYVPPRHCWKACFGSQQWIWQLHKKEVCTLSIPLSLTLRQKYRMWLKISFFLPISFETPIKIRMLQFRFWWPVASFFEKCDLDGAKKGFRKVYVFHWKEILALSGGSPKMEAWLIFSPFPSHRSFSF